MKKNLHLLLFAILAFGVKLAAQPAGWSYYQPIAVTENSGTTLTNYQLKLIVNTATLVGNNQMLASGDDIRFGKNCSGSVLYNYWIESGMNTATTTIWVKVDTLFANSTRNIYMYYGNTSATSASAVLGTFIGPHSATDSVASGGAGGATNSQRGFRFAPNQDVLMTAIGKREPNGTTRYVTLFDFVSQTILFQGQVGGPAAQYSYSNMANPIWLIQGTQYVLELYQGAADGYYFGTSSQIGQHLTYLDMRYCNSCTQNTFPTNTLSNYHYGYPDMWYFTKQNVALAPTYTLNSAFGPLTSTTSGPASYCFGGSTPISVTASGGLSPYTYAWTPSTGLSSTTISNPVANPTATTMYYVTITESACNNTRTDSVLVTVNPLPVVTATASSDSICLNTSTTLTASGASSYSWILSGDTTSSIYVSPTTNTSYIVVGTDANGCVGEDTLDITVLALPVMSATASLSAICDNSGDSVILTAAGATSYNWDNGASFNNPYTVTPTNTTTYVVMGTDAYGCSDTTTVSVTVYDHPVLTSSVDQTICDGGCVTIGTTATGGSAPYTSMWSNAATTDSITVCPNVSTCYNVMVTDANGCSNTDTVCINVNPSPVLTITGPEDICEGSSATLLASGCGNYNWQPGNFNGSAYPVNPLVTTSYTVTCTDSLTGCSGTSSVTLVVNPLPTVTFTGLNSVYDTDAPYNLTAYATPAGGSFSGPGVTGNMFDPGVAGIGFHTLIYTYTDQNGCTNSDTLGIDVLINGITEWGNSGVKNIYPNPFNNQLIVESSTAVTTTYIITDALGRIVLTGQISGTRATIATEQLPAGMYSIKLSNENGSGATRLIKQ